MNDLPKDPRILIASMNPVKANAMRLAYQDMFGVLPSIEQLGVSSGVSDQPMSDKETLMGASTRATGAREADPTCELVAGIEGGIEEHATGMLAFAWVVIRSPNMTGQARSATFPLPNKIADLVRNGMELGKADDIVFGVENSKQDSGAVGLLTDGVVDRESLYRHAATMALIPFKNVRLYQD